MLKVDTTHTTAVGSEVLSGKGHALALISNQNSYFTQENIAQIATEMKERGMNVIFVLPDEPEAANYRAFGYPDLQAAAKARQAFHTIRNRTRRDLDALGMNDMRIVRWENFHNHGAYTGMYGWIKTLFANNGTFKKLVLDDSRKVLAGKALRRRQEIPIHEEDRVFIGADFLLKEYAFLLAAGDVFDLPVTASFYHRPMPIYERLLSGEFGQIPTDKSLGIITAGLDEQPK